MKMLRKINWIALVLCPIVFSYTIAPYAQAYELTKQPSPANAGVAAEQKTATALFEEKIDELAGLLDQPNPDSGKIYKAREDFIELDKKVMADFASIEADLIARNASSEILQRHKQFVARYENNVKALLSGLEPFKGGFLDFLFSGTKGSDRESAILQLKDNLREKWVHAEFDPFQKSEPGRKNADFHPRNPDESVSIVPAYAMNLSASSGALPSYAVNPGDLEASIETALTPGIKNLARQLGYDPVRIFEYVKNTIDYAPYYGSVKGAQETLDQKAGNDFDIASLLIALYHAAGIPARYVYGVVQIPIERVKNWVGITDAKTALNFFASSGIPGVGILSGSDVVAYKKEHVWVEASVPVANYRGTAVTQETSVWVPLDASFKQYTETAGADLDSAVPFDAEEAFSNLMNTGSIGDNGASVANINPSILNAAITDYRIDLKNYIETNYATAKLKNVIGERKIKSEKMSVLPLSLPYQVVSVQREMNVLTDSDRQMVTITASYIDPLFGDLVSTCSYKASMPALAGKRINLNFAAASITDENTILSLLPKPNDPVQEIPATVPAYLIKLKPEIWVNGEMKVQGNSVTMGTEMDLAIDYSYPKPVNDPVNHVESKVTAGSSYAIVWDTGKISAEYYNKSRTAVKKMRSNIETGAFDKVVLEKVLGETLHLIGLNYFKEVDIRNSMLERTNGVRALKLSAAAIVGTKTKTEFLLGEPRTVRSGGLSIDIKRDLYNVMSRDGDKAKVKKFNLTSGQYGSLYEGKNFEDIFGEEAVSTVKIINEANLEGTRIYTVTKDNAASILPKLAYSASKKQVIQSLVNSGREVTIPEKNVTIGSWIGTGYVSIDPVTGVGAYMIDGGLSGGETATEVSHGLGFLGWLIHCILSVIEIGQIAVEGSGGAASPIGLAITEILCFLKGCIAVYQAWNGQITYEELKERMDSIVIDLVIALAIFGLIAAAAATGIGLPLVLGLVGLCLFIMLINLIFEMSYLLPQNRFLRYARWVPHLKDNRLLSLPGGFPGLRGGFASC